MEMTVKDDTQDADTAYLGHVAGTTEEKKRKLIN